MTDWLDPEDLEGAWDRLDHRDRKEVMLWRAVVAQGIRDMASIDSSVALEAAVWLDTDDYRRVCELALLEPAALSIAIRDAMAPENPVYRKAMSSQLSDIITAWAGPVEDQQPL
jgi:hypothetical protein